MTTDSKIGGAVGSGAEESTWSERLRAVPRRQWLFAVVTGFLESVPLGLMMQFGNPKPLIELALPNMYGYDERNLALGWAIHQFHGVALALGYVVAVQWPPLRARAASPRGSLELATRSACSRPPCCPSS